ncbi:hypothetical protein PAXRUDRAFT_11529 [Paxillus rubicundulus Ve08.2h10]|uniref:Uncharacterized protein n=1 Tax=Paxillus rubicundulus Ve08.2h10 TaxID=930991 RepID=A0A0D0E378_9AGAM|nr:hypothetical protein PAXRUDRAFT_11529 [Paxillus rubicundulus Ve08.2h10]
MAWQAVLSELKQTALLVSNCGPASDSILGVKYLTTQHSVDHWEELHALIHTIFGWGQDGGLLSAQSSQADFLIVCDFLKHFAEAEDCVGEGSCLAAMMPRMQTALELCRVAAHSNRDIPELPANKGKATEVLTAPNSTPVNSSSLQGSVEYVAVPDAQSSHGCKSNHGDSTDECEDNTDDEKLVALLCSLRELN